MGRSHGHRWAGWIGTSGALAALAFVACASSPRSATEPPPSAPLRASATPPSAPPDGAAALEAYFEFMRVMDAHKADCEALVAALEAFSKVHGAALRAFQSGTVASSPEAIATYSARADELTRHAEGMGQAIRHCADRTDFAAVLSALVTPPAIPRPDDPPEADPPQAPAPVPASDKEAL